jgi:hypothetical protein
MEFWHCMRDVDIPVLNCLKFGSVHKVNPRVLNEDKIINNNKPDCDWEVKGTKQSEEGSFIIIIIVKYFESINLCAN